MTNVNSPFGGKPINTLTATDFTSKTRVYSSSVSDATKIYTNDFVKLSGGANSRGALYASQATAGDQLVGVVLAIKNAYTHEDKIFRDANSELDLYVIDDPYTEFEIQVNGTITAADIGKEANLIISAGNDYIGVSAIQLDVSTLGMTGGQVKIIGVPNRDDNFIGEYTKVSIIITKHTYRHQTYDDIWTRDSATGLITSVTSTDDLKIGGNMEVSGKLTVGGMIDPTGLTVSPQSSPPATDNGTHYYDSKTDSFKFRANSRWVSFPATVPIINLPEDFPTLSEVYPTETFRFGSDVTDSDITKTHTLQSFLAGQEAFWNGTNYTIYGSELLWKKTGTILSPYTPTDTAALPTGSTAVTQTQADNSTKIATTAYTDAGLLNIQNIFTDSKLATGFVDRVAVLSLAGSTFTITGNHSFYINGKKYSKTTASIAIPNVIGTHWVYYNSSGVLSEVSGTSPSMDSNAFIATVYWDGAKGNLAEERHSANNPWTEHFYAHLTRGAAYATGLAGTFTNTTFSIGTGSIFDEDIYLPISSPATTCEVYYKNGSATFTWDSASINAYKALAGVLQYNNGNTLTPVGNNDYVAYWVFMTNDISTPIMVLTGQRTDTTIANARVNNTYETLVFGQLPYQEAKVLYRVIMRNVGGTATYVEATDYRTVSNTPAGTYVATSHAVLSDLGYAVSGHSGFAGTGVANTFLFTQSYNSHPTFTLDTEIVDKKYVDDAVLVENLWDRSGTVLSPHTSGDTVLLTKTTPSSLTTSQLNLSGSETTGAINTGAGISLSGHNGSTATTWAQWVGLKSNATVGDNDSFAQLSVNSTTGTVVPIKITKSTFYSYGNAEFGTPGTNSAEDWVDSSSIAQFRFDTSSGSSGYANASNGGYFGFGIATPSTTVELSQQDTITGNVTDGYTSAETIAPRMVITNGATATITRHNYFNIKNPVITNTSGTVTITNAALFRFDAAAGTHKCLLAGTTKTTPGAVDTWVIINVNGTLVHVPGYISTTA